MKSFFNKKINPKKELNIGELKDILKENNIEIEEERLDNILKSENGSARKLRNEIVYKNGIVTKEEYNSFEENLSYVLNLLKNTLENELNKY